MANRLTISIKKINYMIFKPRRKKSNTADLNIKIKNQLIDRKQSIKLLGVFVDESLDWKEHFHVISDKISISVGIISQSRFFLSQNTLFKLYFSLVHPYLINSYSRLRYFKIGLYITACLTS